MWLFEPHQSETPGNLDVVPDEASLDGSVGPSLGGATRWQWPVTLLKIVCDLVISHPFGEPQIK